jgi:primosomal protein N' (replication factor Y)
MLIDVALPVPLATAFTYSVPERMRTRAVAGARVRVPFGSRRLIGVILGPANASVSAAGAAPGAIREIDAVLDDAPVLLPTLLELSRWIASYYHAPIGETVRMTLPPQGSTARGGEHGAGESGGARNDRQAGEQTGEKTSATGQTAEGPARAGRRHSDGSITLVRLAAAVGEGPIPLDRRASRLRAILNALTEQAPPEGWLPLEALKKSVAVARADLDRLERSGWIDLATADAEAPAARAACAPVPGPELTGPQQEAAARIIAAIDRGEPTVFALRGVTGSGKTEVYFTAARRALDRGRGVVFLVPEIALTPAFTRRVRERFGDQVELLHSRIPTKQRAAAWSRIRSGAAPLVVGPRSALFAPVARIGLIVVDEEHDGSYKQEETPRYHARDIALVRARLEGASAVLGSATPSVETWYAANSGRYVRLDLPERIAGRPMPSVEIVDMREEFRERGAPVLLSRTLIEALRAAKARGEQSIILLNRRGYAAFALCRACGEPIGCPHCSVSLVYHRSDESLRCHYCDYHRSRPDVCDKCGSDHLVYQGEGTERLERHLERALPGSRVVRLDRDTARAQGSHETILTEFEQGRHDILVGTQMVAKGHDFPGVTVVGVLSADAILGIPDFRAAERTFQLLTQVAGRAGRGDRPGRVLVQAYRRDHYAIQTALDHDHETFYQRELSYRRILGYPPFTNLAAITVSGLDLARTAGRAKDLAARLEHNGLGRVRVLGPALAPIARLRNRYRFQILLKARARRRLGDTLDRTLAELASEKGGTRGVLVDVDPLQLL